MKIKYQLKQSSKNCAMWLHDQKEVTVAQKRTWIFESKRRLYVQDREDTGLVKKH